ncbi:hypothetical protein DPEC_G00096190 [Dallia pectoralis]|uniref:Uncharacterized protein n=1 Tax=Dallia pectoralis TaxID=75939 RepID=A0ACC2GVY2_DALPE|nr:hypothetical protein DPEC_G00096190 [Dallia pectoralis]
MEGNVGFVSLFEKQVKGILDILLDVAVLEITHIFRGTLSNVVIQHVGGSASGSSTGSPLCAGDQCGIQEELACRLKNSLEKAIWAHGNTAETTSCRSAAAALPGGEVGGDMDVSGKNETCDINWKVVEVGVFEGNIDNLRNSIQQNQENGVTLFTVAASDPSTSSEVSRKPRTTEAPGQASQTRTLRYPPRDENRHSRGGLKLGGLAFLTPNANVVCRELVKLLKPCSVRLEDLQHKQKVTGQGNRRLRVCRDCNKIFNRKRKLRRHQRLIHTGEKPYSCSQCDRTFSLRTNLTKHLRVHSGEKPYGCTHCEKHFRSNRKLKIHIRFHTGEKPFGCSLCGKKYRVQKNVEIHMNNIHPLANLHPGQGLKN